MQEIQICSETMKKFMQEILCETSKKKFGYFMSGKKDNIVRQYHIFEKDDRRKHNFEAVGKYYENNTTAGFMATPEETLLVERYVKNQNLRIVGVFHTHMRHPPFLSKIDVDLHLNENLWHMIIAIKNSDYPRIKVFEINAEVKEKGILYV